VLTQLIGPSGCTSLSIVAHSLYSADWFPQNKAWEQRRLRWVSGFWGAEGAETHTSTEYLQALTVSSRDAEGVENSALIAWIWPIYATADTPLRPWQVTPWRAEMHAWGVHRCADVTNLYLRMIHICSVWISTVIAQHSSHEKCKCVRVCIRWLSISVTWVSSHVCPYLRKLKLAADL